MDLTPAGDARRPASGCGGKAPPSAMDPPPTEVNRRAASGGGKVRQGRLGLKKASTSAASTHPGSPAPPIPPPPPSISSSDALPAAPTAPPPTSAAQTGSPAVPPPQPAQGARWGAMFPNFASQQGNQQGSNSWVYPPGGFVHMIQQPHYPPQSQVHGENFHLLGQDMAFNQSPPASMYRTPSPAMKQGASTNKTVNIVIDEDDNNVANNTVIKKRYWTHEEEERLASSWLGASKDPIHGNDKRGDTFWKEVTAEFNRKGNGKRTREFNQLKIHWSRLKSSIGDFNDCWTKVSQMHTSGYSDDMLEEEAQQMYANRFGKRFQLVHWWKILKEEPKWCALFETEKDKTEVVDIPEEQKRPIGREPAKAERSGKHKKAKGMEGIVSLGDTVEKIVKVQQDRKMELEKVTEAQIQISNAHLKAAKEEKEAKMFQVYNTLLNKDTSTMSEAQKASHDRAVLKLEEKLFAD